MNKMSKLFSTATIVALSVGGVASANDLPGVKTKSADLVSPSAANTFYGGGTTHTASFTSAYQTKLIEELADALGADHLSDADYTKRVYEYVKNNIAVEFRYGLSKGARGAILDQSGTPFDQAHLMAELLDEASISSSYKIGTIEIDGEQFGKWTGLIKNLNDSTQSFDVDAVAACRFLADGGIPAEINSSTSASCNYSGDLDDTDAIDIGHIWLDVGGDLYDPSYKEHTFKEGIDDLSVAMDCGTSSSSTCGSGAKGELLNTATYTSGTVPAYSNLQSKKLDTFLTDKASDLQDHLENSANGLLDAELIDVIGGQEIVQSIDETISSTLAHSSSTSVSRTVTGDIPNQYRTSLEIEFDNIDEKVYADEIYDQQVRIAGKLENGDDRVLELTIENYVLGSSTNYTGTQTNDTLTLRVDHPYADDSGNYMDEDYVIKTEFQYDVVDQQTQDYLSYLTIVHGWGKSGRGAINFHSKQSTLRSTGWGIHANGNATYITHKYGASDQMTVSSWLAQVTEAMNIVGQVNETRAQTHHNIGYLINGGGQRLHVETRMSNTSVDDNSTHEKSAQYTSAAFLSRLEASISELGSDRWEGASGLSIMALANVKRSYFPLAESTVNNSEGEVDGVVHTTANKYLHVTSSNKSTAAGQLIGYTQGRKDIITNYVTSGREAIVLQNSMVGEFYQDINDVAAGGDNLVYPYAPFYGYETDGSNASYVLTYSDIIAKGANSSIPSIESQKFETSINQADYLGKGAEYFGVDQGSGIMNIPPVTDIKTGYGDFPYSLSLERSYASSNSSYSMYLYNVSGPRNEEDPASDPQFSRANSSSTAGGRFQGGWTHNFQITATIGSDVYQAMGEDSGIDAAKTIASVYAIRDIFNGGTGFGDQLANIFITDWWGDELRHNTVTITQGASAQVFTKMPDGTYNPPPSGNGAITVTGDFPSMRFYGSTSYDFRNIEVEYIDGAGTEMNFDKGSFTYAFPSAQGDHFYKPTLKIKDWTFPTGVTLDFTYEMHDSVRYWNDEWYALTKVDNGTLGRSLEFTYALGPINKAGWSQIASVKDENGRTVGYSKNNGKFTVSRPDGSDLIYEYDDSNAFDLISDIYLPGDTVNPFTEFDYDVFNRVEKVTDADGNVTEYYIGSIANERFKKSEVVDALDNSRYFTYDEDSQLTSYVSPVGNKTTYEYDGRGREVKVTLPEGDSAEYEYDTQHNKTKVTAYDKTGGDPIVTTATYNQTWNKLESLTDALGNETEVEYFASGNGKSLPKKITRPSSDGVEAQGTIQYTYNSVGQVDTITDQLGVVTKNSYSGDMLISTTVDEGSGKLNLKTVYYYDKYGHQCRVIDPRETNPGNGGYDSSCNPQ